MLKIVLEKQKLKRYKVFAVSAEHCHSHITFFNTAKKLNLVKNSFKRQFSQLDL